MNTQATARTLIINVPVTQENFIHRFLASINGVLRLSEKELEVLAAFMELYDPTKQDVCHKDARRQVQSNLDFPSKPALNNYIKFLREKGVLIHTPKPKSSYAFHPLVQSGVEETEEVRIKFEMAVGS